MENAVQLQVDQQWRPHTDSGLIRHIRNFVGDDVLFSESESGEEIHRLSQRAFIEWIEETGAVPQKAARLSPGLELGHRIRLLREMAGMSQQQLADAAGISRSAVAFWETGRSGHVGKHLGTLADVLGVQPEVLLTGMAYKEIPTVITPDENILLSLYRRLDPLIKIQAQKWVERRARQAEKSD